MQCAYDITRSYEENFERGPFFARTDFSAPNTPPKQFLGLSVRSRMGIAAGLLLNSRWLLAYAARGFDLLTYKTVRSRARPSHPQPNWVFVEDDGKTDGPVFVTEQTSSLPDAARRISSAICFGMPSMAPEWWREDVARAKAGLGAGQLLIVSVVASPEPGWTTAQLAADYAQCAAWAAAAGADVIEANLSCPNLCPADGPVYWDTALSREVAQRIRDGIGSVPLLLKVGQFEEENMQRNFLRAVADRAQGITVANNVSRPVLHRDGRPVFGDQHEKAGVVGRLIHEPAVQSVRGARRILAEESLGLSIAAVGGVASTEDAADFFEAGADAVMMGGAPMYLPDLAAEIKTAHPEW